MPARRLQTLITLNLWQQAQRNDGACLRVGQCVVVTSQVIAASCGNGVKLMIGQGSTKMTPRGRKRVKKTILGIWQRIGRKNGLQATFIKTGIVGHKRYSGKSAMPAGAAPLPTKKRTPHTCFDFEPDSGETGGIPHIVMTQSVNALTKAGEIVGTGVDKAVKVVDHLPIPYQHQANGTDAARLPIGCFKINADKVLHGTSMRSILKITGLVPSEQHVIIQFSSLIHPFIMEPPCNPA